MTSFHTQLSFIEQNFIEIKSSPQVVLDLKYATTDNFMQKNVYQSFHRCFLSPVAFKMFENACHKLKAHYPNLQFKIWDALRPRHIQADFYNHLKGTPFQNYVAEPHPGSLHNFGMALDLTLQTKDGVQLDMGTGFDDFSDLSQPALEEKFLKSGQLTPQQFENRQMLRQLMENEGFKVLPHEWWHFNALPKEKVYSQFPILE